VGVDGLVHQHILAVSEAWEHTRAFDAEVLNYRPKHEKENESKNDRLEQLADAAPKAAVVLAWSFFRGGDRRFVLPDAGFNPVMLKARIGPVRGSNAS
jgi:hypothetical protein